MKALQKEFLQTLGWTRVWRIQASPLGLEIIFKSYGHFYFSLGQG